ncbi:polysaccharide deacetylase [Streptomyces sp. NPDC090052]|uniref:polysaccharide deacetylase family protein n=1 Tax=unclassified Streptomyces TaxID=2593676 RepID=UPI00224DDED5|nr:polysaccharide deacetylase [Streptomyces sp. NBC_01306]MCX4723266.1 polysaccharide deacetylase [Streptomyces sp. NBC_01306]
MSTPAHTTALSTAAAPGARWPGGARSAVALAFDLDGPTGDAMLSGEIWRKPAYFSLGAYGPYRALPRILGLLRSAGVTATFFVPAWVIETWPDACLAIVEQGHEVAHHGYRHERYWDLTPAEQAEVISRSQEVFTRVLGAPAQGFRTPSGDWHPQTPRLLLEAGFTYSSSMRGDDRPYFHEIDGAPTSLVEIPGRWDLDDYASLAYTREPDFPKGQDRIASYELTLDNWIREFDGHHAEGLCMTTLFHPKVSGKPGRLLLLERFLAHMSAQPGVWFAACREIAAWWAQRPAPQAGGGPEATAHA